LLLLVVGVVLGVLVGGDCYHVGGWWWWFACIRNNGESIQGEGEIGENFANSLRNFAK
jgi:hypothetical protein